jgi:serine/threonine-protein kinase 24/25/MST4
MPSDPEESWDFDTIRSMDTIRTNPFASDNGGTMRRVSGASAVGTNTALMNLALNSAPSNDNADTRGRNATYTRGNIPIQEYGTMRRRTNTSIEADQSAMEDDPWQRNEELSMIVPETAYGKMGSTVRLFRRVPDHSDRARPYGTISQDAKPVQDENRAPVIIPSSKEGILGRQVHSDIVQPAIEQVSSWPVFSRLEICPEPAIQIQPQTTSSAERNALARLDGAWKDLDAINPEMGYHLVRNLLERLQQRPQLQSVIVPSSLQNQPYSQGTKPKLSGDTLFGTPPPSAPIRAPKEEITRCKRAQSNASNHSKSSSANGRRPSTQADDFIFSDEEENPNKSQGEKLADVLYGRWLEGLRTRWEDN